MLNKLRMFAAVALAMLVFASCTKDETSMSIYDLAGRAKISGVVTYSVRDSLGEDGYIERVLIPKSDVEILAKIANKDISGDETTLGYSEFRTKTNAEGYYEFELPVPDKEVKVALQAQSFEGVRTSFDSLVNKKFYCSDKEGVFTCKNDTITVKANDIKSFDFNYVFPEREITSVTSTLTVNVFQGVYKDGVPTFIKSKWSPFKVTIKDEYNNIEESQNTENGETKFKIIQPDRNLSEFTIKVEGVSSTLLMPYDEEIEGSYQQFYHNDYSNWNSHKVMLEEWNNTWNDIDQSLNAKKKGIVEDFLLHNYVGNNLDSINDIIEYEWPRIFNDIENKWSNDKKKKFNDECLILKKKIWTNSTDVEWNNEWNNKTWEEWKDEIIEKIWKESFTNQMKKIEANSYTYIYPNEEDYPMLNEKPKIEDYVDMSTEPNYLDYGWNWELYKADHDKWIEETEDDRERWRQDLAAWKQGYNTWREENKQEKVQDVVINVYMVFNPDDIEDYYKYNIPWDEEKDEENRSAYDFYYEWIDAFATAQH